MIYKVSYVEESGQFPGGIKNEPAPPRVGDQVQIGPRKFKILSIEEILPPRENFQYLQATVTYIDTEKQAQTQDEPSRG